MFWNSFSFARLWFLNNLNFVSLSQSATTKIGLLQTLFKKRSELFKTSKNFKNYLEFTKLCIIQYYWFLDISQFRYLCWSATTKIRLLQAYVVKKSERIGSELFKTSKNFKLDWKFTKLCVIQYGRFLDIS